MNRVLVLYNCLGHPLQATDRAKGDMMKSPAETLYSELVASRPVGRAIILPMCIQVEERRKSGPGYRARR